MMAYLHSHPLAKGVDQVIHVLDNLDISPQNLLAFAETTCCAIHTHLLLDEASVLRVLVEHISLGPSLEHLEKNPATFPKGYTSPEDE